MDKTASFTIGKVTGVHGLNGNLKVWSYAQSIDTFCQKNIVLLHIEGKKDREYTILKALPYKKGVLLTLKGVDNRDLANTLVGCDILIDRDQLPEPEDDAWYWQDLLGLNVEDETRGFIGKITDIFPTGANDVLVVKDENKKTGDKETLIPMHRHFVTNVDLEKKVLETNLPEDYE